MKAIHNPLRLNLGFMLGMPVGSNREITYDYKSVVLDGDLPLPYLTGKSDISRSAQGLVVKTRLSTSVRAECGRCLTEFDLPITTEFTELFVFFHNKDRSPDDLVLPEDGYIDLGPIAREQLLLEVPINAVCRPDCKGLCPVCGGNLNEQACGHEADPIDPRLAPLKKFLKD